MLQEGTSAPQRVRLEIFADVACPWCFIAKRRLERVLATQPPRSVQVQWRAYELQPTLPRTGVDARTFFLRKFGGERQMRRAFDQVTAIGADEGIAFDFDRMRRAPNTLLAHQAIVIARGLGRQEQMVDALFRGHFEQGVDVGSLDELLDHVEREQIGLDRRALRAMLERDAALPLVRADLEAAAALGVNGVPFFFADGGLVLAGAQPSAIFERMLAAARQGGGSPERRARTQPGGASDSIGARPPAAWAQQAALSPSAGQSYGSSALKDGEAGGNRDPRPR